MMTFRDLFVSGGKLLIILQLPIKRRLFLKRLDLTSVTNNLFHVRLFRTENLVAMEA